MRALVCSATLLSLLVGPAACSEEQPQRPDARPPSGALGLKAGDPVLAQALRAVLQGCQVSEETGRISRCTNDEDDALRRQERVLGVRAALVTYCHGLGEGEARARALAASGLSRLAYYQALSRAGDPKLLSCLLGTLDRLDRSAAARRVARPLARASAYLATVLKREAELLPRLKRARLLEVKEAGYGALWVGGRARVLDTLSALVKSNETSDALRVAVINGFALGGPLRGEELSRVCSLVAPLLDAEPLPVASAAARCAAELCPGLRASVLQATQARAKAGQLDPGYVSAVRIVAAETDATQREQIVALLTAVVEDGRLANSTRAAALSKVSWIDRSLALRLARKQLPQADGALRQTALWLLDASK